MNLYLQNKVVLISGGSSGIGLACAQAFLNEGAAVCISARRKDKLQMLTTMGLAQHYGPMGVRVNAINPSLVLTPRFERRFEQEARQANTGKVKLVSDLSKNIPLRRYAQACEIADIALFLGSARSSYISGAVISADGAYRPSL